MASRMRTLYTVTAPAPTLNGRPLGRPTTYQGDCPRWAAAARRDGLTVVATRVRVLGPADVCSTCAQGYRH